MAKLIQQNQNSQGGDLTRSSSTEDYPPSDSVNDSYQEHWSDQGNSEEDLINSEDTDIAKFNERPRSGNRNRSRMRKQKETFYGSDTEGKLQKRLILSEKVL